MDEAANRKTRSAPDYAVRWLEPPGDLTPEEAVFFESNRRGELFENPWGVVASQKIHEVLMWGAMRHDFAREKRHRPALPVAPHPLGGFNGVPEGARLMWLGHASFLVEVDGVRLLTDPIFGAANTVVRRVTPFPLPLDEMPPVDAVLISHCHYDHLCVRSLRKIARRFGPGVLYLVPRGARRFLPSDCEEVVEMDWWRQVELRGLSLTFLPAQHCHRRSIRDQDRSLWGAWAVAGSRKVFFAGDTGYFAGFRLFGRLFDGFDAALLPLGAFEPRDELGRQHMSPEDSLQAFDDLRARHFVGMHWGTYDLSKEPLDLGPRLLGQRVREEGRPPGAFHVLAQGGSLGWHGDEAVEAYAFQELLVGKLRAPDTVFEGASEEAIASFAERLAPLAASGGECVLSQGDEGSWGLYVLRGELEVRLDGRRLGACGPGGILGEVALFSDQPRVASAWARRPCEFLVLTREAIRDLRDDANPVVYNLERAIVVLLVERLRELAAFSGRGAAAGKRRPVLSRLFAWLGRDVAGPTASRRRRGSGAQPANADALRQSRLFEGEAPETLDALAALMRPMHHEPGRKLMLQGARGEEMHFVTEGRVDVLVDAGRGPEKVQSLGRGAVVGVNALVTDAGRTATCEAAGEARSLVLDRGMWTQLYARDDRLGSALRVAVIRALCHQFETTAKHR